MNCFVLIGLSCLLFLYSLTAQPKTNLLKFRSLLLFAKDNSQKNTSNINTSRLSEAIKKFRFPPLGSSRKVTTGATRNTNILKVLVPSTINEQNTQSEFHIYSTYSEYPTFVIYFKNPQTIPKDTIIKFTLHNSNNSQINETYFQVKDSGIYLFPLPRNQSGLKININYSWQFSLVYGDNNKYTLLSDRGLIKKQFIPAGINQQLEQTSEIERLMISGKNQIWYDTISYLTNLYCSDNNTYKESWRNLLNSHNLNLDELENEDTLSCHDISFLTDI